MYGLCPTPSDVFCASTILMGPEPRSCAALGSTNAECCIGFVCDPRSLMVAVAEEVRLDIPPALSPIPPAPSVEVPAHGCWSSTSLSFGAVPERAASVVLSPAWESLPSRLLVPFALAAVFFPVSLAASALPAVMAVSDGGCCCTADSPFFVSCSSFTNGSGLWLPWLSCPLETVESPVSVMPDESEEEVLDSPVADVVGGASELPAVAPVRVPLLLRRDALFLPMKGRNTQRRTGGQDTKSKHQPTGDDEWGTARPTQTYVGSLYLGAGQQCAAPPGGGWPGCRR